MKIQLKFHFLALLALYVCALKPSTVCSEDSPRREDSGGREDRAPKPHNFVADMEAAARAANPEITDAQIVPIREEAIFFRNEVLGLGDKGSSFIRAITNPPEGQTPRTIVDRVFSGRDQTVRDRLVAQVTKLAPNSNENRRLLTVLGSEIQAREAAARPGAQQAGAAGQQRPPRTQAETESEAKALAEAASKKKLEDDLKLQQAFLQGRALQQAQDKQQQLQQQAGGAGGGGGSGGGSGGGGGGAGSGGNLKPPTLSSPEGIGEALEKFKHGDDSSRKTSDTRNAVNPNNFNNFGNSGSSGSEGSSEKKKTEENKFNFDTSAKVPKTDDTSPKKKEDSGETQPVDANNPLDPSALGLNNGAGNPGLVLSGPTSVGQLIQNGSVGGAFSDGGGGDSGSGGSLQPSKNGGAGQDSGFLGGGDPFKSVGMVEMPPMDPPIRKVSVEMGGGSGGDGGDSGGGSEGETAKPTKAPSFISQLVLTGETTKTKALGLMAFIGTQLKDACDKADAEGKEIGICLKVEEGKDEDEDESSPPATNEKVSMSKRIGN